VTKRLSLANQRIAYSARGKKLSVANGAAKKLPYPSPPPTAFSDI
jgi:hypothetical protein